MLGKSRRVVHWHVLLIAAVTMAVIAASALASEDVEETAPEITTAGMATGGHVAVERLADGSFQYVVDGQPQVFLGIGYNPIYRYLSDAERAASYDRDFRIMCEAGLNHITGWDADKGYEQDKFDQLTLDYAAKYGIGVVMPIYLPADGDYEDGAFRQMLALEAAAKVAQFKDHPALRMWGVGNEVLHDMLPGQNRRAFGQFYLELVDLLHSVDPNHPIIYREAEDTYIPAIARLLQRDGKERSWLLYGANAYTARIEQILDDWPSHGLDRPLFITEFGAEADWLGSRAVGYLAMWQMIRSRPQYVLGGAPYVWTTDGPEPTDALWGLMDANGQPIDETFDALAAQWRFEQRNQCQ